MSFLKNDKDVRGSRCNFQYKDNIVSLFEIKKGFSRGGQYHKNEVIHILISGKIDYRKENIITKSESKEILTSHSLTCLPPNTSDLITALEDSIMIGIYKKESIRNFYEKHSEIVKAKMKKKLSSLE